jgi:hypothetical protein
MFAGARALLTVIGVALAWTGSASASSRAWSAPTVLATFGVGPGNALYDVACPSADQCTAIDSVGEEVTFNPRAPRRHSSARLDPSGGGIHGSGTVVLAGVACPSVSQCTGVDSLGREFTFDPAAPGSPALNSVDSGQLFGVACPSVSQCTAVDNSGREVTFDPTAPGTPSPIAIDGSTALDAVACPTASQCTAVERFGSGREVTFDPTTPRDRTSLRLDSGQDVFGLACPTANDCITLSSAWNRSRQSYFTTAVEGNPRRSRPWTIEPISQAGTLIAVACSSVAQCVAVDGSGHGFVGIRSRVTTRLTSSARSAIAGQRLIFTATISSRPASGRMMFLEDGRRIPRCGAIRISAATSAAKCHTSFAKPGFYAIQAAYIGRSGFSSSQSLTVKETVRTKVRLRRIRD